MTEYQTVNGRETERGKTVKRKGISHDAGGVKKYATNNEKRNRMKWK